jgi:HEAT repeat protein
LYLLYARRLAEVGERDRSAGICRRLIKNYTSPHESNIPCTALSTLVEFIGERAFNDLLSAMDTRNMDLRARALELASLFPGELATAQWIKKLSGVEAEVQAEIISMLGHRGDKSAVPVIRKALKSEKKAVRLAAIPAAARLGGNDVLPDLFSLLPEGNEEEIEAVKLALLGYPAEKVIPESAGILEEMPPFARSALIDLLSQRHAREHKDLVFKQALSEDEAVRTAALAGLETLVVPDDLPQLLKLILSAPGSRERRLAQNAAVACANLIEDPEKRAGLFLETMGTVTGEKRAALLTPLSRIGGKKALQVVIGETKNEDPSVVEAAVRSLAAWPDIDAAGELLTLLKSGEFQKRNLMMVQGYVRLVRESDLSLDKKLDMLKETLNIPLEGEEKSLVLNGLAGIPTLNSLRVIIPFLDDIELKSTAARLAAVIALPRAGSDVGLTGGEVINVLKKSVEFMEDSYEQERVKNYIGTIMEKEGFVSLFNGKDLTGWKGLVEDPVKRAKMTPEEIKNAQEAADKDMLEHWKVIDNTLVFDGKGHSLCTVKDYKDFEMLVDWKIEKEGDSGIYLRGAPQVQIWDPAQWPEGSGGLYNNQKGPSKPLKKADNPIGEWNTFRIKMVGDKVTVHLNGILVVDDVVMENYWERDKPIYRTGQIELQAHSTRLYFKEIYIREILPEDGVQELTPEEKEEGFTPLFNGKDLSGWTGDTKGYVAENGKIVIYPKRGSGNLYTEKEFSDFILRFEFKLTPGANNGLGIRAPLEGDAAYVGMELQILDNTALIYKDLQPWQYHGSIYGTAAAKRGYLRPVGEWNSEEVIAKGSKITVILNGNTIVDADITDAIRRGTIDGKDHPGLKREKGHIGFLGHGSHVEFRNIRIKELK